MAFYRERILPRIVHWSMRQDALTPYRHRVTSDAEGRVLEVGIGSGLNLPLYSDRVDEVVGLDPSGALLSLARKASLARPRVGLLQGSAEAIPLDARSVDTVVTTWTLCSVPDAEVVLDEIRRVLRPLGRMLFVEHGRAPDPAVERWQHRLTPVWKRLAGGCHLDRPIDRLIQGTGFRMERLAMGYAQGPRVLTFMYEGCARPQ